MAKPSNNINLENIRSELSTQVLSELHKKIREADGNAVNIDASANGIDQITNNIAEATLSHGAKAGPEVQDTLSVVIKGSFFSDFYSRDEAANKTKMVSALRGAGVKSADAKTTVDAIYDNVKAALGNSNHNLGEDSAVQVAVTNLGLARPVDNMFTEKTKDLLEHKAKLAAQMRDVSCAYLATIDTQTGAITRDPRTKGADILDINEVINNNEAYEEIYRLYKHAKQDSPDATTDTMVATLTPLIRNLAARRLTRQLGGAMKRQYHMSGRQVDLAINGRFNGAIAIQAENMDNAVRNVVTEAMVRRIVTTIEKSIGPDTQKPENAEHAKEQDEKQGYTIAQKFQMIIRKIVNDMYTKIVHGFIQDRAAKNERKAAVAALDKLNLKTGSDAESIDQQHMSDTPWQPGGKLPDNVTDFQTTLEQEAGMRGTHDEAMNADINSVALRQKDTHSTPPRTALNKASSRQAIINIQDIGSSKV